MARSGQMKLSFLLTHPLDMKLSDDMVRSPTIETIPRNDSFLVPQAQSRCDDEHGHRKPRVTVMNEITGTRNPAHKAHGKGNIHGLARSPVLLRSLNLTYSRCLLLSPWLTHSDCMVKDSRLVIRSHRLPLSSDRDSFEDL